MIGEAGVRNNTETAEDTVHGMFPAFAHPAQREPFVVHPRRSDVDTTLRPLSTGMALNAMRAAGELEGPYPPQAGEQQSGNMSWQ